MKSLVRCFCAGIFTITALSTFAQTQPDFSLQLQSGVIYPQANFSEWLQVNSLSHDEIVNGYYYRIVQFHATPTQQEKERLEASGIQFLEYLPYHAYVCAIPAGYNRASLVSANIRSVIKQEATYKTSIRLIERPLPDYAMLSNGKIAVHVQHHKNIPHGDAATFLRAWKNVTIEEEHVFERQFIISIDESEIASLAAQPWVSFLEPIDPPAAAENLVGRTNHRSNVIASDYFSGRHYDGTGVNVVMGDDGVIGPHIDYEGRTDQSNVSQNNGDHGDHVAGAIMGAGNLDPKGRGMAFGATLYVYSVWDGVDFADDSYQNDNVRITSTSYSNGCNAGYTQFAQTADDQIYTYPSLMHVFSAGNDGTSDCGYGAGAGWGNVTGGVKVGKNVTTVANLGATDGLANSSSRGPTEDGRIKPDVAAVGTSVYSTIDVNDYDVKSGTSMSCPGVSGTYAQLYHAYRDLNGGNDPESALMKAVLMNGADDLGNPGPDFKFGYGRINAANAVSALENNTYMQGSITQSGNNTHNITVPAGVRHIKIMAYWTDYAGSPGVTPVLVNDLDMTVTDPNSTVWQPWILDPTPNVVNLDANAVRGADHINNTEQVTLDDPVAGTYTVNIDGFNIPQGPQTYYLVYTMYTDEIMLTYPIGGEGFVPGESELIRWDAWGDTATFDLDYSTDGGATWTNIFTNNAGTTRTYSWTVPGSVTSYAKLRITRGANMDESDSTFTIISVPQNFNIQWICPDSLQLDWDSVPGAASYEVSELGPKYMDSIATTLDDSIVLYGTDPTVGTWYSVRAVHADGGKGRRAFAIEKPIGVTNCSLDADGAISQLISPSSGTLKGCSDNSAVPVIVELFNEGVDTLFSIPISYSLNGGGPVTETWTGTLLPDSFVTYTFTSTINLSNTQFYDMIMTLGIPADGNPFNDSASVRIETVAESLTVNIPWSDDFESNSTCGTQNNCGNTLCQVDNWINDANNDVDDIDWRVDRNGTASNGTGPDIDFNPGTTQGRYLYLEASAGCNFKVAQLNTPCIDLTNAISPQLLFHYHMYGADMGSLHVDAFSNGQWELDITSPRQGNWGDTWRSRTVDLSDYVGEIITIRFRGITGPDYASDAAIDDIHIYDLTSIEDIPEHTSVNVWPNPTSGEVSISMSGDGNLELVEVYDVTGKLVLTDSPSIQGPSTTLNLQSHTSGVYLLKVYSGKQVYTHKLILRPGK